MYLLYLDDSGSASNPSEDYFVLGGVCVFERQVYWLAKQLDDLAQEIDPAHAELVEFHASDIFSGRLAPWNGLRDKESRRGILRRVLQVLADAHATTCAFACAVHKESFPGMDPVEIAFEELCRRFDLFLKRCYAENDPQRGILVLDKSAYETSLQKLSHDFRSLGTQWGVVKNMVDVPFFVDSRASRILQLADHVAYGVFRRYNAHDTSYIDLILKKFDSVGGKIHGLVHKQAYDRDCMCPACMSRRLA